MIAKTNKFSGGKYLGIGLGLRIPHYQTILGEGPPVDWFEIISENFTGLGGRPREVLESVLETYPVIQHGVSLCPGNTEAFDQEHLAGLKRLTKLTGTPYISDHLCWGSKNGTYSHDLLPLPYTKEAIKNTANRIKYLQDYFELPFCIENVSSYVEYVDSVMTEWQFLSEVAEQADCGLLLDLNNVHVSAFNHGFDPLRYVSEIPLERVGQIHIAGPSDKGDYLLDTHDHPVPDRVWELYSFVISKIGPVNTLLEWDNNIPSFEEMHKEALKAGKIIDGTFGDSHSSEDGATSGAADSSVENAGRLEETQSFVVSALKQELDPFYELQEQSLAYQKAEQFIQGNSRLDPADRLGIYCRQYWYRLLDCFKEDFPGILHVLGRKRFERLARSYIAAYSSDSHLLKELGRYLADFVELHGDLVSPFEDLVFDLARFEYAQVNIFDMEGLPPLTLEDMSLLEGLDLASVSFRTQPYLVPLSLSYALDDFSIALRINEASVKEAGRGDDLASDSELEIKQKLPEREQNHLVVHRFQNRIFFKRLEPHSFVLLQNIRSGMGIAEAVALLLEAFPDLAGEPDRLAAIVRADFATWARLGWLVRQETD